MGGGSFWKVWWTFESCPAEMLITKMYPQIPHFSTALTWWNGKLRERLWFLLQCQTAFLFVAIFISLYGTLSWLLLRKSDAAKEISPLEMELNINLTTFLTWRVIFYFVNYWITLFYFQKCFWQVIKHALHILIFFFIAQQITTLKILQIFPSLTKWEKSQRWGRTNFYISGHQI